MSIPAKPWKRSTPPKRILAIRLQAMGDVVISLPYLQHLRKSLPGDTVIDFLTREEDKDIPKSIDLFNHVYTIRGYRNFKKQFIYTLLMLPKLLLRNYDVVLDLQNNLLSRIVRKSLSPKAWVEFDKYSLMAAGERNRRTIEAASLGDNHAVTGFDLKSREDVDSLLKSNGWKPGCPVIVLNPAGAFENRNWPIGNYIDFARLCSRQYPTAQFLILGIDKVASKAVALKEALGDRLINLVNKTTPSMAFAIMQRVQFVLSEDSGLMHMAWVSGIPTLAIFGSTRSIWSRPLGPQTDFLDSSDMECGSCLLEQCRFEGDKRNRCMTRFTPEAIFERALRLMAHLPDLSRASS